MGKMVKADGGGARRAARPGKAGKTRRPRKAPAAGTLEDEENISYEAVTEAIAAIMKRVRVDRRWDIPYLAGYSRAGRTIFIDRNLPKTFSYQGRRIKIDPFLVLHEAVEIAMLDKLDIRYDHAHQIALLVERSAVLEAGIQWAPYHEFMLKHIRRLATKRLDRVPRNLNLTPYLDEEDLSLLGDMLPLMFRKWQKEGGGTQTDRKRAETKRKETKPKKKEPNRSESEKKQRKEEKEVKTKEKKTKRANKKREVQR